MLQSPAKKNNEILIGSKQELKSLCTYKNADGFILAVDIVVLVAFAAVVEVRSVRSLRWVPFLLALVNALVWCFVGCFSFCPHFEL